MKIICIKCGRQGDVFEFAHYWGEGMDTQFDLLCPEFMCEGDGMRLPDGAVYPLVGL